MTCTSYIGPPSPQKEMLLVELLVDIFKLLARLSPTQAWIITGGDVYTRMRNMCFPESRPGYDVCC